MPESTQGTWEAPGPPHCHGALQPGKVQKMLSAKTSPLFPMPKEPELLLHVLEKKCANGGSKHCQWWVYLLLKERQGKRKNPEAMNESAVWPNATVPAGYKRHITNEHLISPREAAALWGCCRPLDQPRSSWDTWQHSVDRGAVCHWKWHWIQSEEQKGLFQTVQEESSCWCTQEKWTQTFFI